MKTKRVYVVLLVLLLKAFISNAQDTLQIGYYYSPPFVETTELGNRLGVSKWVWDKIMHDQDIVYQWVDFSDEEKPLKSILESLKNQTIDACLNPLTIHPDRIDYIQFSQPYFVSNLTVVQPKNSSWQNMMSVLKGFFSINFWRTVAVLFVVLFIFGLLVWLFERKHTKSDFHPSFKGIFHGIWWSAVTMTTVGYGDKSPKTIGGRIVALIWMFSAIILISGFTANFTTSLTLSKIESSTTSFESLKDKEVATVEGSATDTFLSQQFFRTIKTYPTLQKALLAVDNELVDVLIYDEPFIRYWMHETDKYSNVEISSLRFNVDLYGIGFRKGVPSELITEINHKIIHMRETADWKMMLLQYHLAEI